MTQRTVGVPEIEPDGARQEGEHPEHRDPHPVVDPVPDGVQEPAGRRQPGASTPRQPPPPIYKATPSRLKITGENK